LPSTIEKLHRDYKDAGLVILPVSIEEGRGKVSAWLKKQSTVSLPTLLDPDGDASAAYHITATPTVYLVGRDGKLVAKALGTKDWTSPQGRALLQMLLRQ
jgi:AhpC/TSA family protein